MSGIKYIDNTMVNVQCFFCDCTNPVVGQCPGYHSNCGRFYCKEHSNNILCSNCDKEKVVEFILSDYTSSADGINKSLKFKAIRDTLGKISIIALIILVGSILANIAGVPLFGLGALIFIIIAMPNLYIFMKKYKKIEDEIVGEIDEAKPGFRAFYNEYEKYKQEDSERKSRMLSGIVAGTIFGMAIGVYKQHQKDQDRQALKDIRDDIRKIASKK